MSLRHLFAGILVGVFAMALSSNPAPQGTEGAIPSAVAADKGQPQNGTAEKTASQSDDKQAKAQPAPGREASGKNDKPVAPERTWAQRLVFPAGNKF